MTDTQIIISILSGIIIIIITVLNFLSIQNLDMYKKKYDQLQQGLYKYEPNIGFRNSYFHLYNQMNRTDVEIIFFSDGDIKLTDNLYIHKSQLWMSFINWHYYRKFHKLKDKLINQYVISQEQRRRAEFLFELYNEAQKKLDFKFLRG